MWTALQELLLSTKTTLQSAGNIKLYACDEFASVIAASGVEKVNVHLVLSSWIPRQKEKSTIVL